MEALKRLRRERGLSQKRLADLSGVDEATINQIERGRRSPQIATLEKLADAMEIEVADFFPKAEPPLPFVDAAATGGPTEDMILRRLRRQLDETDQLMRRLEEQNRRFEEARRRLPPELQDMLPDPDEGVEGGYQET